MPWRYWYNGRVSTTKNSDVYEYKNVVYRLIGEGKMKDPTTRAWFDCVYYVVAGSKGLIYTREKIEFYNRFKVIPRH